VGGNVLVLVNLNDQDFITKMQHCPMYLWHILDVPIIEPVKLINTVQSYELFPNVSLGSCILLTII